MNDQALAKTDLLTRTAPLLLVVVGAVVYANSLSGPFIYDDIPSIVENEDIRQLWPIWSTHTAVSGRPVAQFSLAINYAIGGLDVRGYHLVNIAVHLLCALTLFGIVRRTLLGEKLRPRFGRAAGGIALTCSLLWMVHPLQTECVDYLTQRTESLMGLFSLLTLYCAIRAMDSGRRAWGSASVLSCALGMASKEVMVTAPLMVLLYDGTFKARSRIQALRQRWGLYIGLAATWLLLVGLLWSDPRENTVGFSSGISAREYALNQCVVLVSYLRKVFWPHPLLFDYGIPQPLTIGTVWPYAILLASLLFVTAAALWYRPMLGFLGAWFFIVLAPTSSFVPIVTEVGAERRMYLPLAGLVVLVVIKGYAAWEHAARQLGAGDTFKRRLGNILVIAVASILSYAAVQRNRDYLSPVSIWQTVADVNPLNPRAHVNLGLALKSEGEIDQAIHHYQQALRLDSHLSEAHNNLGTAFHSQGKLDQAIHHYRQAVEIQPDYAEAHHNLGIALRQLEERKKTPR